LPEVNKNFFEIANWKKEYRQHFFFLVVFFFSISSFFPVNQKKNQPIQHFIPEKKNTNPLGQRKGLMCDFLLSEKILLAERRVS